MRFTVEFIDPRSGRTKLKRMVGDPDKVMKAWNAKRQGDLLGVSMGWQYGPKEEK